MTNLFKEIFTDAMIIEEAIETWGKGGTPCFTAKNFVGWMLYLLAGTACIVAAATFFKLL